MHTRQLPVVLRYLRGLVGAGPAGDPIDRELLERFAAGREEAAFEALIRLRHLEGDAAEADPAGFQPGEKRRSARRVRAG